MTDAAAVTQQLEEHLKQHLDHFLPEDLQRPWLWKRLPSEEAMSTADYPAVAVACPGTVPGSWQTNRHGSVTTLYRVVAAVWVQDFGEDETTSAVQRYTAALRDCILAARRPDWRITGEDWSQIVDPLLTQTLGGGRVTLEVPAAIAAPEDLPTTPGTPLPVVTSHETTVSLKE